MLVVPAIDEVNVCLAGNRDGLALLDVPGGGAEGVSHRKPGAARIGDTHALAQLGELRLFHQQV